MGYFHYTDPDYVLSKRFGYGDPLPKRRRYKQILKRTLYENRDYSDPAPLINKEIRSYGDIFRDRTNGIPMTVAKARVFADSRYKRLTEDLNGGDVFSQKLIWFWTNYFSVRSAKTGDAYQNDAIAPNIYKKFPELLAATIRHSEMMMYLNNNTSKGPNSTLCQRRNQACDINENLARELLELHTVGPGAYDLNDIRETAKILTGHTRGNKHTLNPVTSYTFNAAIHEPGTKTVMGITYPAGKDALMMLLNDLALHKKTARNIAKRMLQYFNVPHNGKDVTKLATVYLRHKGHLMRVYRTMIDLPGAPLYFSRNDLEGSTPLRPFDYYISVTRSLHRISLHDDTGTHRRGQPLRTLRSVIQDAGHEPYTWATPDGQPMHPAKWMNAVMPIQRWNGVSELINLYRPHHTCSDLNKFLRMSRIPLTRQTRQYILESKLALPQQIAAAYMSSEFQSH